MILGRMTVTRAAVRNGDFTALSRAIRNVARAVEATPGAALIVSPATPKRPWYRSSDVVDVIAVERNQVAAEVFRLAQSVAESFASEGVIE